MCHLMILKDFLRARGIGDSPSGDPDRGLPLWKLGLQPLNDGSGFP